MHYRPFLDQGTFANADTRKGSPDHPFPSDFSFGLMNSTFFRTEADLLSMTNCVIL
jgi:hypothetical protein